MRRLIRLLWGSIANRVFLLLVCGMIAAAALTLWMGGREEQRHFAGFHHQRVVDHVTQLVQLLNAVPPANRAGVIATGLGPGLRAQLNPPHSAQGEPDEALSAAIAQRLGPSSKLLGARSNKACMPGPPPLMLPQLGPPPSRPAQPFCQIIDVQLSDGTPLRLILGDSPRPMKPPPPPHFALQMGVFLACIAVLAYFAAQMTVGPLKRLAQHASEFGDDMDRPPLPEEGPEEVRKATSALNAMKAKILQHVQQRVYILAAIAHDLQTPLTRLRLRLDKVEDADLRHRLVDDLASMQLLVKEGLDYARSMDGLDSKQRIDVDSLLASVCDDAVDAGQRVIRDEISTGALVQGHPGMLYRCLMNLVENAVKYGDFAHVSMLVKDNEIVIQVRDGGPGIPASQLEAVFQPFYRLEVSRSRKTGGVGLGLAIARNIAERHGGRLWLENSETGAIANLVLPRVTLGRPG